MEAQPPLTLKESAIRALLGIQSSIWDGIDLPEAPSAGGAFREGEDRNSPNYHAVHYAVLRARGETSHDLVSALQGSALREDDLAEHVTLVGTLGHGYLWWFTEGARFSGAANSLDLFKEVCSARHDLVARLTDAFDELESDYPALAVTLMKGAGRHLDCSTRGGAKDPLVALFDRYGAAALALLGGTEDPIEFEASHRELLSEIASRSSKGTRAMALSRVAELADLTDPHLLAILRSTKAPLLRVIGSLAPLPPRLYPVVAELSPALRESLPIVVECFGELLADLSEGEKEHVIALAKPLRRKLSTHELATVFRRGGGAQLRGDLAALADFAQGSPRVAPHLIAEYGVDGSALAYVLREDLQRVGDALIAHDAAPLIGPVTRQVSTHLLSGAKTILTVIERAWWGHDSIATSLSPELAEHAPDFVVALAENLGGYAAPCFDSAPLHLLPSETTFLLELAQSCAHHVARIYAALDTVSPGELDAWRTLHARWGAALHGIAYAWGRDAPQLAHTHERFIGEIIALCGRGAGEYLAAIPGWAWSDPLAVEFARVYRSTAARELQLRRGDFLLPDVGEQKMRDEAASRLGVRNFYRYSCLNGRSELESDLIRESLRSLNPRYREASPLAICIHADADHNNAFAGNGLARKIEILQRSYKVIVLESAGVAELCSRIEGITMQLGRRADLLWIGAHGQESALLLGSSVNTFGGEIAKGVGEADDRLTTQHTLALRSLGANISRGGSALIASCATARGGARNPSNFARAFSLANPHVEVWAARDVTSLTGMRFTNEGRFLAPKFACGRKRTVRFNGSARDIAVLESNVANKGGYLTP